MNWLRVLVIISLPFAPPVTKSSSYGGPIQGRCYQYHPFSLPSVRRRSFVIFSTSSVAVRMLSIIGAAYMLGETSQWHAASAQSRATFTPPAPRLILRYSSKVGVIPGVVLCLTIKRPKQFFPMFEMALVEVFRHRFVQLTSSSRLG